MPAMQRLVEGQPAAPSRLSVLLASAALTPGPDALSGWEPPAHPGVDKLQLDVSSFKADLSTLTDGQLNTSMDLFWKEVRSRERAAILYASSI